MSYVISVNAGLVKLFHEGYNHFSKTDNRVNGLFSNVSIRRGYKNNMAIIAVYKQDLA